jgi:hypothetical protein
MHTSFGGGQRAVEVLRVKAHSIEELHQPIDETEHLALAWQSPARKEPVRFRSPTAQLFPSSPRDLD